MANITVPPMSPMKSALCRPTHKTPRAGCAGDTPSLTLPTRGREPSKLGGFDPVSTAGLGLVQRPIGRGHQTGRIVTVLRQGRHTQADGHRLVWTQELGSLGDPAKRFGQAESAGLVGVAHEHRELFAAGTKGRVGGAFGDELNQPRNILQGAVPLLVAMAVVDLFEVVDVD